MKTYLVYDNDEGGFVDCLGVTTDVYGANHYSSLSGAKKVADEGEDRIVLEWK